MKTNGKRNVEKSPTQGLTPVFAAEDRRTDQWRALHALSRAWPTAPAKRAYAESLRADAVRPFGSLVRLKHGWAYPGPCLLTALDEAIAERSSASFARLVRRVSAALPSGDYRREEPLLFKPGQFYVSAAFTGCLLFALLALQFKFETTKAALIAIGATFVFRALAIRFNWTARSLWQVPPPPPPAT